MPIRRLSISSMSVLLLSASYGYAGPCSRDIARLQARVDARIDAYAATKPFASQSTTAQLHRQPTPGSVAMAESIANNGAPTDKALAALGRARSANRTGNRMACSRALTAARKALSQ